MNGSAQLVDERGRKYLTVDERQRFIRAAAHVRKPVDQTFVLTITHTGARVSEVLALRALDVDLDAGAVRMHAQAPCRALARGAVAAGAGARSRDGALPARGVAPAHWRAVVEILASDGAPEGGRGHAHGKERGAAGLP